METHRDKARRLVRQLGALPTVDASLTRLAADRLRSAKIDLKPVLLRAGLTQEQISDPDNRIAMQSQVAFLNVAAEVLDDDTLGLTLAAELDCRSVGLLYYVLASSDTLGTALERASRYSRITNETLVLEYRKGSEPAQRLGYASVQRHVARHQVEFLIIAAIRIYRLLTGRHFVPTRVSMVHVRSKGTAAFSRILGTEVAFGSSVDEIVFPTGAAEFPLVDADPRLNKILRKVCEESLNARKGKVSAMRTLVENTITPLLPHGTPRAEDVAKALGMSERTLARRLAEEGTTFIEILQQLKATLARQYLEEDSIPISKVAWLLGFEESSSFSHACKRWTGKTPRELRSAQAELA